MSPLVELRGVSRTYRHRSERIEAIRDVDLIVESGSMLAVVGPSGSGKTTLLDLVIGWEYPDSGEVVRSPIVTPDWAGTAVVPQGIGLVGELTLLENIELPSRLGNPSDLPTAEVMDLLALDGLGSRHPDELSMGERQRGSVARALATRSALVVADEPTAHQDEHNVFRVMDALSRAARRGAGVVVATHDERVFPSFDYIVRLSDGAVVKDAIEVGRQHPPESAESL